jgi:hypothetical protein
LVQQQRTGRNIAFGPKISHNNIPVEIDSNKKHGSHEVYLLSDVVLVQIVKSDALKAVSDASGARALAHGTFREEARG